MLHPMTNLGGVTKSLVAGYTQNSGAPIAITAAGTGDNTAVTGETIDRQGYDSLVFVIAGAAALQATETLAIAAEYQESADGSTWDTAVALQAATTAATGDTGGSNETFEEVFDLNLRAKKRYIRVNFTPNLSASGTDTAVVVAVAHLAGAQVMPVSA